MFGGSDETIRLEGFSEFLKGQRIFCVGTPNVLPALVRSRLSILDAEAAHRGRRVLLLQDGSHYGAWLLRMKWDAVFVLKDSQDLRLALTYILHSVRPTRVVYAGGEPASAVFHALARAEGVSLLGLGNAPPMSAEWSIVFWSHDMAFEVIEPWVGGRTGTSATSLRSVLREIHASEVGLVWSNVGESDRRGSLYWYDPTEGAAGGGQLFTPQEAADLLRSIADSVGHAAGGQH